MIIQRTPTTPAGVTDEFFERVCAEALIHSLAPSQHMAAMIWLRDVLHEEGATNKDVERVGGVFSHRALWRDPWLVAQQVIIDWRKTALSTPTPSLPGALLEQLDIARAVGAPMISKKDLLHAIILGSKDATSLLDDCCSAVVSAAKADMMHGRVFVNHTLPTHAERHAVVSYLVALGYEARVAVSSVGTLSIELAWG